MKKWLILSHRYVGIGVGILVVMWFATGIAMMYAGGMPTLTPEARLRAMDPVDLTTVRISPAEAAERAAISSPFPSLSLVSILGRPAYRFGGGASGIVFADSGELLGALDAGAAVRIGARHSRVDPDLVRHEARLTRPDQWTFAVGGQLPLHKLRVDDGSGANLYVSERSAEVALVTTRGSRRLAWIAAIPHWLYVTPLRSRLGLWTQVILWTAGFACALALLGITLGLVQAKVSRPLRMSRIREYVPYRGWMRWHYIAGSVFGLVTLTWAFSGFLSMEPWGWASGPSLQAGPLRAALAGRPFDPTVFPELDPSVWPALLPNRDIKEVRYSVALGDAYYIVSSTTEAGGSEGAPALGSRPDRTVVSAESLQVRSTLLPVDTLVLRVREIFDEHPLAESALLDDYDSYYYSRRDPYSRGGELPLPVLRVKLGDPDETWLYIDPRVGELRATLHRLDRVERWLYSGLHSLDFPFWYRNRPLWDAGVLLLLLGGLATSGIGLCLGAGRIWRGLR